MQFKNTRKTLIYLQFYDDGIMFMGSFTFRGMLGSCPREGMCMLTLISEKCKLIMLIKQALTYGNIEDISFFEVNTKYISSSVFKTSEFS